MACSYPKNEEDFVDKVQFDLTVFVESSLVNSVLVFPPVNSFYRFLIHQLAQDNFDQLRTFSIGEDPERRIVVCTKDLVARVDASKDEPKTSVRTVAASSDLTMVVSDTERSNSAQVKKSRTSLPTIGIYRPPAARRSTEDSTKLLLSPAPDLVADETPQNADKPARSRLRRPDQQVYVPRAKRTFKDSDKFEDAPVSSGDNRPSSRLSSGQTGGQGKDKYRSGSGLIIDDRKSSKPRSSSPTGAPLSLPPRASHLVETKKKLCQSTSSDLDLEGIGSSIPVESERLPSTMNTSQQINLPSRAEVLVEKKKKLCQTGSLTEDFKWKTKEGVEQEFNHVSDAVVDSEQSEALSELDNIYSRSKSKNATVIIDSEVAPVIDMKVTETSSVIEVDEKCDNVKVGRNPCQKEFNESVLLMKTFNDSEPSKCVVAENENHRSPLKSGQDTESSDEDYQDAHNEPNRLLNISDRSSGASSESLSSSDSVNYVSPVQLMKPVKTEANKKSSKAKPARVFNPDECDWDALLDEDVLDPFLMKELTSAVGEVQVTQPKSDYRNYRSQVPADQQRARRSTGDEDFGHVLEIFSFPPEFKTSDLVAVLSPFKNTAGGFEIKWVDDTHALGVFASTLVAEQVLAYQHPMVRMRPLCEATLESRLKARRLSESIHSFRPRPETCAALARRLVTGALGVKLPTARQEREEEKRVLREAREKRRLAVQQQDDIWNS